MSLEAETLLMYARNLDALARTRQLNHTLDDLYAMCLERAKRLAEMIIADGF